MRFSLLLISWNFNNALCTQTEKPITVCIVRRENIEKTQREYKVHFLHINEYCNFDKYINYCIYIALIYYSIKLFIL